MSSELSQILQKEEEQKERVKQAQVKAKEEINQRKQALQKKIAEAVLLEPADRESILAYQKKETAEIAKRAKQKLADETQALDSKQAQNLNQAAQYLTESMLES